MRYSPKSEKIATVTLPAHDGYNKSDFVVIDPDVLIMSDSEVIERLKSFFREREKIFPIVI